MAPRGSTQGVVLRDEGCQIEGYCSHDLETRAP